MHEDILGSGFYFSYIRRKERNFLTVGGWTAFHSSKVIALHSPTLCVLSHLRPVFFLFSQLPALIETLDPQPLEELLPGEERAHLDLIGIRDGFSFPEFLVCGTPACCF